MIPFCDRGLLQAHSSVERAGLIASIRMRKLPTDEDSSLRGQTLRDAINKDRTQGLFPIFVRECYGHLLLILFVKNISCLQFVYADDSTVFEER
ncbi:hypothetical protein DPMN_156356 [Dreissena polymorpha]|uniref:Uncharacterized protein n=1 Tax=Dreissena polymorpha TaxID=45954 RepID=A0A9D4FQK7_DREPO|nr:hypothetical protein DPMN_156356 [Dreissena polymorpha]